MGRLLFIGSTVADVIVRIPFLPVTGQDLHVKSQQVSLGGCAYNAYAAAKLLDADALLFSPCGTGVWADWIRKALSERKVTLPIPTPDEPNGCCYCLVEDSGERTFLSDHGAEYRFRPEWFDLLGNEVFDCVYLCCLYVEETTGPVILDYLESHPPKMLCYAPGPRICRIAKDRMDRLLKLSPMIHLNESEAMEFTGAATCEEAAKAIHVLTGNDVVITRGADGALVLDESGVTTVPAKSVQLVDTIGAGDNHIGAIMAGIAQGLTLPQAAEQANRLSEAIVSHPGATITPAEWAEWQSNH